MSGLRRHKSISKPWILCGLLKSEVSMKKAVSLASKISGARKNLLYEAALKELAESGGVDCQRISVVTG